MDNETIATKKDYQTLVKHNKLIKSRYTLTTAEQKLLYKLFEHIQKHGYTTRKLKIVFDDFYRDFKKVHGMNLTKEGFKNLVEGLQMNMPYIIKGDEFVKTQWYRIHGKLDYSEITLELDEYVFEYIQAQKGSFTQLSYESLYSFKKAYTFKIYELLKQWARTKTAITFTVEEFKADLDILDNSGYKNFSNIEKRIIIPAVEEINTKSEMKISYKLHVEGRKTKAIEFYILKHEPIKKIFSEIKTTLKDGVEDVEVLQGFIDVDVLDTTEAPQQAPASATSFYIPEDSILSVASKRAFKRDFNKYDFSIEEYKKAFYDAEEKVIERDNMEEGEFIQKHQYDLFATVLNGNIATLEANKKSAEEFKENLELYAPEEETEAPASEENQGVELPSWIQNLNNYDK